MQMKNLLRTFCFLFFVVVPSCMSSMIKLKFEVLTERQGYESSRSARHSDEKNEKYVLNREPTYRRINN